MEKLLTTMQANADDRGVSVVFGTFRGERMAVVTYTPKQGGIVLPLEKSESTYDKHFDLSKEMPELRFKQRVYVKQEQFFSEFVVNDAATVAFRKLTPENGECISYNKLHKQSFDKAGVYIALDHSHDIVVVREGYKSEINLSQFHWDELFVNYLHRRYPNGGEGVIKLNDDNAFSCWIK